MRLFRPFARLSLRLALACLLALNVAHATFAEVEDEPAEGREAAIWKNVLSHMPAAWKKARPVKVRWVSDRQMDRLVKDQQDEDNQRGDDSTIQGFYDRPDDDRGAGTITVREDLPRDEATFVLSHEFSHMVWDDALTRRQRSDYRSIWTDQRRLHRLVSRYAGESVEEGFSEAVASYLWRPERLKRRDGLSYDFVANLVRAAAAKEPHGGATASSAVEPPRDR